MPGLVLVVEDTPDDEMLTLRALRLCAVEHSALVARDGGEAVTLLGLEGGPSEERIRPQLVLLDLKLPRKSGFEVLEAIRADEELKDTAVAILSSSAEPSDIERATRLGVKRYIQKPIEMQTYIEAVQSAVRELMP